MKSRKRSFLLLLIIAIVSFHVGPIAAAAPSGAFNAGQAQDPSVSGENETSGETAKKGFFERVWEEHKLIVIFIAVLVVLILVVLKITLFPRTPKGEPAATSPEAAIDTAPADNSPLTADNTCTDDQDDEGKDQPGNLEKQEQIIREQDVFGTVTVTVEGKETGTYPIAYEPGILGRDPDVSSILVEYKTVSKKHLKIVVRDEGFYIVDLGSTNGTYVNGEIIKESQVTPNDSVQLGKKGDVKLFFKQS